MDFGFQSATGIIGTVGQSVGVGTGAQDSTTVQSTNVGATPPQPNVPTAGIPAQVPVVPLSGQTTVAIGIQGMFTGTLVFEGTVDGTNYLALNAAPVSGGAATSSTTGTGAWLASISGLVGLRVRSSAWTSGGATITLLASSAVPPMGAGGNLASGLSSKANLSLVVSTTANNAQNLLSANAARQGFIIDNETASFIDVALANTAFTTLHTVSVASGATFTMGPPTDYTGAVSFVGGAGSGSIMVTELVP